MPARDAPATDWGETHPATGRPRSRERGCIPRSGGSISLRNPQRPPSPPRFVSSTIHHLRSSISFADLASWRRDLSAGVRLECRRETHRQRTGARRTQPREGHALASAAALLAPANPFLCEILSALRVLRVSFHPPSTISGAGARGGIGYRDLKSDVEAARAAGEKVRMESACGAGGERTAFRHAERARDDG